MSISIERAVGIARKYAPESIVEEALLSESLGRVLAQDVFAPITQPPFDRSPLDGYAVCAEDTEGASQEAPVQLQVVDHLCAGEVANIPLQRGQAVRLMTGAMLPEGTSGVIRQEDTDFGEKFVQVFRGVRFGENCCRKGEEYEAGSLLLPAGTRVDAASIAVAAGAGISCLPMYQRAKIAIISTGDEICQPGQSLPEGKIYDSNRAYLAARLRQLGADVVNELSAGDSLPQLCQTLEQCAECNILLTTGGVSVGEKDLLELAVVACGAQLLFHGIAIKPGMPTLMAKWNHTLILGLSGNPFSAAVPLELLLRPILAKMTGDSALEMERQHGVAADDFTKSSPTRRFLRAWTDGHQVKIPGAQANGQMRSMVGCNCLVDVPAKSGPIRKGDPVDIWML